MKNKKVELKEFLQELRKQINDISNDFVGDYSLTCSSYICDAFSDYADSRVDIYYYDLFEWAKNNYDAINEATAELGSTGDICQDIRQGQYLEYDRQLYADSETIIEMLVIDFLINEEDIEELEETQLDEILDAVDLEDTSQRLEDIAEVVKEKLDEIREAEADKSPDFKITLNESASRYIIYKNNEYYVEMSKEGNPLENVICYIGQLLGVTFENFFYNSADGQPVTVERMQSEEPEAVEIEGVNVFFIYGEE